MKKMLKPKMTWEEAVKKGDVEQLNRHLGGKFELFKNPMSVTVMDSEGKFIFRARSVKAAAKRVQVLVRREDHTPVELLPDVSHDV